MEGERIIYIHVKVKIERELLTASRSSINLCLTCVNPGYSMKGKAETVVARVKVKKFFISFPALVSALVSFRIMETYC